MYGKSVLHAPGRFDDRPRTLLREATIATILPLSSIFASPALPPSPIDRLSTMLSGMTNPSAEEAARLVTAGLCGSEQ